MYHNYEGYFYNIVMDSVTTGQAHRRTDKDEQYIYFRRPTHLTGRSQQPGQTYGSEEYEDIMRWRRLILKMEIELAVVKQLGRSFQCLTPI